MNSFPSSGTVRVYSLPDFGEPPKVERPDALGPITLRIHGIGELRLAPIGVLSGPENSLATPQALTPQRHGNVFGWRRLQAVPIHRPIGNQFRSWRKKRMPAEAKRSSTREQEGGDVEGSERPRNSKRNHGFPRSVVRSRNALRAPALLQTRIKLFRSESATRNARAGSTGRSCRMLLR